MPRIFHVAALVVLALWLPATMHCDLESWLAVTEAQCCDDHGEPTPGAIEHCAIEDGDYFANQATITVAAPALFACWNRVVLHLDPPAAVSLRAPARSASPPELARTWQFTARAALPARAPSLVF